VKFLEDLGSFGLRIFVGMIEDLFGENRGRLREHCWNAENYWGLPWK